MRMKKISDFEQKFPNGEKWEWSWNGNAPYYLIDALFSLPIKEHIRDLHHIDRYSLVCSEYGKRISAYIVLNEDYEKKCCDFFDKHIKDYIHDYRSLLDKTVRLLSRYKSDAKNRSIHVRNPKEPDILLRLLVENIKMYLISQPEITSAFGRKLYVELDDNRELFDTHISYMLQPDTNLFSTHEKDFNNLVKIVKKKKNYLSDSDTKNKIFDFYWTYRSFYMVDINADIDKEFRLLNNALNRALNNIKIKKRNNTAKSLESKSDDRGQLAGYLKKIGLMRLEGKNVWMNLTLLLIDVFQDIAKEKDIPLSILEKYSTEEVLNLLKIDTLSNKWKKRQKTVILISNNSIDEYFGSEAIVIEKQLKPENIKNNFVHGTAAYPGKVSGTAFVVTLQDTLQKKILEISKISNPILVAEQTVPAYLPLIVKSKGIITNEGGILSHAAIVSREYKIPALIGTKVATQTFKTGERIVLDTKEGKAYKK